VTGGVILMHLGGQYGHMIVCMTSGVTGNVDVAIGDCVCDWGLGVRLWMLVVIMWLWGTRGWSVI